MESIWNNIVYVPPNVLYQTSVHVTIIALIISEGVLKCAVFNIQYSINILLQHNSPHEGMCFQTGHYHSFLHPIVQAHTKRCQPINLC